MTKSVLIDFFKESNQFLPDSFANTHILFGFILIMLFKEISPLFPKLPITGKAICIYLSNMKVDLNNQLFDLVLKTTNKI